MANPLVVVVEPNESYLASLEIRLVEMLWDTADIEIISDQEYFEEYFTMPKTIDVLVIDSSMYSERLQMHDINKTFVLTENADEQTEPEELEREVVWIYKVSKFVADKIVAYVPGYGVGSVNGKKETGVVAVISPAGGSGATTIAMGLSTALYQNLKKVLYVNIQMYQAFHFYLNNKATLPMEACVQLKSGGTQVYEKVMSYLMKEGFAYLPPLKSSRENLGIGVRAYVDFIKQAKNTNYYDFIVVDIGSELSTDALKILDFAKKVYIVTHQDSFSAFKLDVLRREINCKDTEKYTVLCNCFEKERENSLITQVSAQAVVVQDYIELVKDEPLCSCEDLADIESIKKQAYMLE